ncbi:uncharacterized protein AMSG_07866 [Thecamonas trahens ATCC 50062]|uniref:Uncharacterized protein n=1 Tax=Thecamonas trahens ATCC 50062 TaxID=461836 RepID=A0A0L0DI64_THETB|nr:hypothetical protein AMSG_07866 [Thecamonas trahens ATCC 50062]KNC51791.1 hypothetical protein AMSG_07866 [Thecamonas trahens ATCC 50062]|eukprot:XP_013755662.1 hypothetical protein AMSG_07866 [Thecamonas trahens ATCC 50062]
MDDDVEGVVRIGSVFPELAELEKMPADIKMRILRPSTKFDLTVYFIFILGSYILMRIFYGIDLLAVVLELFEIAQH